MKGVYTMERTITIKALQEMGVDSWSVKDSSPRGIHTAYTSEIKAGDRVVIDDHFTTVTEAPEEARQATAEPQEEPAEIDPAELLEDIDTGDHGDRLNDYRDSDIYIGNAISEIADSDTSIYYSDILNFIRENPEALADVVAEGLYTVGQGAEYDLYKHGQAAEYMTIERDIYDHMRDAVLLCAVDFIRYDLKRETIPEELADLLQEWADKADNNDRMNEIPDKIREYFGNAEESVG